MLISNEVVFRGHPDKVADQISDAILDAYLKEDKDSRVAIEVMGSENIINISGEVSSSADVNAAEIARRVLDDVGYDSSLYSFITDISEQSSDIAKGVDNGGAGDQGIMFGYAVRSKGWVEYAQYFLQEFSRFYDELRKLDQRFLPDGKAIAVGEYDHDGTLKRFKNIYVSYQNTEKYRKETDAILRSWLIQNSEVQIDNIEFNTTGSFKIGGFEGDVGLTGRKIVVDTYHGFARVGGGAFSGKDPTKVDRSAAYMARRLAIESLLEDETLTWSEIQVAYVIGKRKPISVLEVNDHGVFDKTEQLSSRLMVNSIIDELGLKDQKYEETARFGHFGNYFEWDL